MSRTFTMTRGIVLTAVVGAFALAGCTPPLPPDVLAAKAENQITCQSGDQPVAVPDDFLGAMSMVSSNLAGVCPEQSISDAPADQAAKVVLVDHAPSAEAVSAFKTASACPTEPIVVPAFAYPVSIAYNIIGLEGLVLTPDVVAGMLNGSITSWEDPAIATANEGVDLTGLPPITVLAQEGASGAVQAMTTWLSAQAPEVWTAGAVDTLPSAATTYPTATDLLADLTITDGAIAVLPVFEAVNNAVPVAWLPVTDTAIDPSDSGLAKVGAAATTLTTDAAGNIVASPAVGGVPTEGNLDLAAAKIVLAEGQETIGWPVMAYAHLLVCDDPADPLPLATAQYIVRLAGQGGLETFGVTPLPEPIRIKTFTPLKVQVNPDASVAPTASTGADGSAAPSSDASPAPSAS